MKEYLFIPVIPDQKERLERLGRIRTLEEYYEAALSMTEMDMSEQEQNRHSDLNNQVK